MSPETLKLATADLHDEVERRLDLTKPGLTAGAYVARLERFFGFYRAWERAACAAGAGERGGHIGERSKRLREDLRFFGRSDAVIEALPDCPFIPRLDSPDRFIGSQYVLEGAALGGRFIARAVAEELSLSDGRGYSFFAGDGAETGTRWRAFKDRLTTYNPVDEAAVIAAARETFQAFADWIDRGDG